MNAEILVLRFDAPMMSFGDVRVDELGATDRFPGRSMLVGLLGNALGWEHSDVRKLSRLQERLVLASRIDCEGERLVDYQTVDLSQEFLREGWTTWGAPSGRAGGSAKTGTHIRYRHYWAGAVVTVAVSLHPAGEEPTVGDLEQAVDAPARPLFLGRKACLPASRVRVRRVDASDVRAALAEEPLDRRASPHEAGGPAPACFARWPAELGGDADRSRVVAVYEDRDWRNQVHVGRRLYREGMLGGTADE